MGIRVLRIMEYTYADATVAESDMGRWTHSHQNKNMTMRTAVLPFEFIVFVEGPAEWEKQHAADT